MSKAVNGGDRSLFWSEPFIIFISILCFSVLKLNLSSIMYFPAPWMIIYTPHITL